MLRRVVLAALALSGSAAFASGLPAGTTYVGTEMRVGGLVGDSVFMNLLNRGFTPTDSRVYETIAKVGAEVESSAVGAAAAAGGAGRLLPLLTRLNPYISGALLIGSGISWLFNHDGSITVQVAATGLTFPAVNTGDTIYCLYGGTTQCAANPVTAFVDLIRQDPRYTTISAITDTNNGIQGRHYFHASVLKNGAPDGYDAWFDVQVARGSCPAGTIIDSNTGTGTVCGAAVAKPSDYQTTASSQTMTPDQAVQNLPSAILKQPMTPEAIATIVNGILAKAAADPNYSGLPQSATQPVTAADVQAALAARPATATVPTVGDLVNEPLPDEPKPWVQTGFKNANETSTIPPDQSASAPVVKPDLGPDPGISPPSITDNDAPDFFKPIKDAVAPLMSFAVPAHSATCPTWHAAPVIAGTTFAIDLTSQCDLFEQYRSAITAACLVVFIAAALFIVLSA